MKPLWWFPTDTRSILFSGNAKSTSSKFACRQKAESDEKKRNLPSTVLVPFRLLPRDGDTMLPNFSDRQIKGEYSLLIWMFVSVVDCQTGSMMLSMEDDLWNGGEWCSFLRKRRIYFFKTYFVLGRAVVLLHAAWLFQMRRSATFKTVYLYFKIGICIEKSHWLRTRNPRQNGGFLEPLILQETSYTVSRFLPKSECIKKIQNFP